MTKKSLTALIISIFCFVALMIIATFWDLNISVAIGNADSVYGQFFNYLGEFPAWFGIPLSFLIFYRAYQSCGKKWLKYIFLVGVFAGFFFLARYLMSEMTAELKWKYLYVTLFGLTMTAIACLWIRGLKEETAKKLVVFAVLLIALIAVSQGITTVLKYVWSRQRFRTLQIGNTYAGTSEGFTPWYKPTFGNHDPTALYPDVLGGKGEEGAYRSFPSGHTAAAAASFAIIVLPDIFDKLKKYRAVFYVVPVIYTVLVGVSRIVNRAHYLSDVTIAGFYTAGLAYLFRFVLKKIRIKYKPSFLEGLPTESAAEE